METPYYLIFFLFQGRMTRSTSSSAGFTNGNGNSTCENRNSTSENRNSTSEYRNSTSENNGHCSSSLSNDIEPTHSMFIKWMNIECIPQKWYSVTKIVLTYFEKK